MEGRNWRKGVATLGMFALIFLGTFVLVRCSSNTAAPGMGAASVTISDPPSCTAQFDHVYVTITGVEANMSATASPNSPGWQNLTTQLSLNSPVQLDLLNLSASGSQQPVECLLKQLGSTQSLPVGSYEQIRLMLADNGSSTGLSSSSNNCALNGGLSSGTVDCVEDSSGTWYQLQLNSQDQTGLKIPPGQILGGPINVAAGKTVDLNINFNTCASLVFIPANNDYMLKPTLTASQVSPNTSGISGNVVSGTIASASPISITSGSAVPGATVNLELPGGPSDTTNGVNTDTVYDTAITDTNGNFYFCPVSPESAGLDVVANAPGTGTASTAGTTIVEEVPNGTKLTVPIIAQGGSITAPGVLSLTPAASTSTTSSSFTVNVDLFPLQLTAASSGYEFIVPPLAGSTGVSAVISCASGSCTVTTPTSGTLTLNTPATSPLVGMYPTSGTTINWTSVPTFTSTTPSTGQFVIEGNGSVGDSPMHTCNTFFTQPQTVTAGAATTVPTANITFSNCK